MTNSIRGANFFSAADLLTQYRIVVEGITNDGRIVHGEKLIPLKNDLRIIIPETLLAD